MKLCLSILCMFIELTVFSQLNDYESLKTFYKDMPENTQLSIAIIENGKPIYYGVIKQNDSIQFIENKDKLFETGSITKVFTSTLLAQLITDKKIELNAEVSKLLKSKINGNPKITLLQLANHTSGIPRLPSNLITDDFIPENPYKNYHIEELKQYLKNELKINSAPGTQYNYSNTGAGLLGVILGISQNSTFPNLLQKQIFDRYGMNNSFSSATGIEAKMVSGLKKNGSLATNWDWDAFASTGCIVSSVDDLTKFALEQFNPSNKAIVLTHVPTFTISENMKIGLGWHVITSKKFGKEYIWHNGGTGGYSSSIALDVSTKNGVIILSNVETLNGEIDQLCFDLLETIN